MTAPHSVVIGAGIGGLAAAIGLSRAGWQVTVLEQADALRPVGGGIGITPNGLHALNALDTGNAVRAAAIEQDHGGIRTPKGRWISRTDLDFIRERFGEPVVAIHRATLVDILVGLLPPGTVRTGARVVAVRPGDEHKQAEVHTATAGFTADLVVAADGIRSATRRALFPDHPGLAFAGYTSWRVVIRDPPVTVAGETWGRGRRFSLLPLAGGLVHCSALAAGRAPDGAAAASTLARYFARWHAPIPALIAAATDQEIVHDDIEELATPLPALHVGRVALVGDAAHAMTPNLGSANLAIEDAVSLCHSVESSTTGSALIGALARYTRIRQPRCTALARLSRQLGVLGTISFPPAVAARNAGFWLAGLAPAMTVRTLDQMMGWRPPQLVGRATG